MLIFSAVSRASGGTDVTHSSEQSALPLDGKLDRTVETAPDVCCTAVLILELIPDINRRAEEVGL